MKRVLLFLLLAVLGGAAVVWFFFPEVLLKAGLAAERGKSGLVQHQLQVAGHEVHYLDSGPGPEQTILFVHGFAADKDNWTPMAAHLPGYRLVAVDLPGFGESGRDPEQSYDSRAQVARLHAIVAAIGLKKFHIVGNSMGGHISALYTLEYPQQVRTLALFNNAGVESPVQSELNRRLQAGEPNPLLVTSVEDFDRMMAFVMQVELPIPAPIKRYFAERAVEFRPFNEKIFNDYRGKFVPLEPLLGNIQQPVLILWGEFDRLIDVSSVEVMRPLLQKPSVVIMQDTGHAPMLERPAATASHYRQFLESAAPTGSGA